MARGLDFVLSRNAFYVRTYRRMLVVSIILTFLMCLLVGLNVLIAKTHPTSKYFPTTPDGKLTRDPPLNENHLSFDKLTIFPDGTIEGAPKWLNVKNEYDSENGLVRIWVERAIESLFNFDYKNYRLSITKLRDLFTHSSFEHYKLALLDSRNLELVKAQQSIVYVNILEEPQLEKVGMMGDRKVWMYLTPIEVVYETPQVKHSSFVMVKLIVMRESILIQHFFGLKILQVNLRVLDVPEAPGEEVQNAGR